MLIGCPKEIKTQEYRVGLVPSSVRELAAHGHRVMIQSGAGAGIDFTDDQYREAGADIVETAAEIFERAEMIVKVKEPQPAECKMLRSGQVLFTYLHLAADRAQAEALMKSGCIAIAYETVTDSQGGLPLLAPMSEVAGRLSVQVGADYLMKHKGGAGRLISGAPGVRPGKIVIIGGGVSGFNAARMAVGFGAEVTILERHPSRLRHLDDYFAGRAVVVYSNQAMLEKAVKSADLVIGAVLIPGASAPKLVPRSWLKEMNPGSVLVDIAIDQGGCFETSHPTTHDNPVYTVDGILHYCVANMPGAVPLTSALALNHAVLPYALELADKGWKQALSEHKGLRNGLNVCGGKITHKSVAESLHFDYVEVPHEMRGE